MNRGSCLCGAVQFEAGPYDSMVHCHCSMCRRHHGAMFATFLMGGTGSFRWLAGEDAITVYRSSEKGLRPFCRNCGSVAPTIVPELGIAFVAAGNLGIMVSGEEALFQRLEPLLRDIGPNVFYIGPGDEARVMKLALQILITGTGELLAEAVALGEANGLDRGRMLEVMGFWRTRVMVGPVSRSVSFSPLDAGSSDGKIVIAA